MQRRTSDRYAKLRRLLGQETTAANNLAFWQRAVTAPSEQWRGQVTIANCLASATSALQDAERAIAAEMRCLLGQQGNGQLVIRRDGNGDTDKRNLSCTDIRFADVSVNA